MLNSSDNHFQLSKVQYPEPTTTDSEKIAYLVKDLVDRFDSSATVRMLELFHCNTSINMDDTYRIETLRDFIVAQSIIIFELEKNRFFKDNTREYRDARMACYKLLELYTKCTHNQIGRMFKGRSKRHVQYHLSRCVDGLNLYERFYRNYRKLEAVTIEFIGKLKY